MYTKTEVLYFLFQLLKFLYTSYFFLYTDCPKSRFSESVLTFARNALSFTNANLSTHASEKIAY